MTKDNSEAADVGRGRAELLLSGEAVGAGKLTLGLREEFAEAVRAMLASLDVQSHGYINHEAAAPFVAGLPEFWREPARVMACVGYYASADEWMAKHVEGLA